MPPPLAAALALTLALAPGGRDTTPPLGPLMSRVRAALRVGEAPGARWPRIPDVAPRLRAAYDSTGWTPLWLRDGRPTPAAAAAVRALAALDAAGLRPADHDAPALAALLARWDGGAPPALADAVRFELLLGVGLARALAALQWGRVDPRDVHESFRAARDDYDLVAAVRAVAGAGDPAAVLAAAEPPLQPYRVLRAELARQRALAAASAAPAAARRVARRIQQLELALERWRWLPHVFPGRLVLVDIPAFRLWAFDRLDADTAIAFSMKVVVGQAFDHRTPVFTRPLARLVFSPYWEVPPSIARKELRPDARRDPALLARQRYVLLRDGHEVPASDAAIEAMGTDVAVRQRPGPDNAMGRVKFLFPNPHNVYMHDTPTRRAFAQARRDLSHGCIRLDEPVRLARWVLRDRAAWGDSALAAAMARDTPLEVPVTERIPVYVLYETAMAEPDGTVRFASDVYGHDRRLVAALARGYPYRR